ncbi:Protein kinase [Spraguea lophii 42_110]|uniref:Protein kinase n=1 Tax=Spraguea lophii (strain 42_110) TaxID=1358809 RepID=S7W873_SPRLO|nr:Protein kinase [Spraguea lophii 42_110]
MLLSKRVKYILYIVFAAGIVFIIVFLSIKLSSNNSNTSYTLYYPEPLLPENITTYKYNLLDVRNNKKFDSNRFHTKNEENKLKFRKTIYDKSNKCCFPSSAKLFDENLARRKLIGVGAYGNVYETTTKCCGNVYALKVLGVNDEKEIIDEELYFLEYFQHNYTPNVIKGYYGYKDGDYIALIYEYLNSTLENKSYAINNTEFYKYNSTNVLNIAKSLVLGIAILHKNNIIHRDIKPDNIGIDSNNQIKIFDFGISKNNKSQFKMNNGTGTILFMPPERLVDPINVTFDTDWYALGITLYILVENYYPYEIDMNLITKPENIVQFVKKLYYSIMNKPMRPFQNKNVDKHLKEFIRGLITKNKHDRLGYNVRKILNHKYFENTDIKEIYNKF